MLIRERSEPDFSNQALGFRTKMSYKIQYGQIIESVEVKQIFRIHNRKTFVIDQTARPKDVEPQVLVGMRPAFAVPFFADDS
jgi:hypothetical protein